MPPFYSPPPATVGIPCKCCGETDDTDRAESHSVRKRKHPCCPPALAPGQGENLSLVNRTRYEINITSVTSIDACIFVRNTYNIEIIITNTV